MAQAKQVCILSVEDHPVFRQGLPMIIETKPDMVLVGQAANGVAAMAEFRRHRPDITLMDLRLPGLSLFQCRQKFLFFSAGSYLQGKQA